MKSAVLPSFWKAYDKLDQEVKQRAQKAFRLWAENPFHPSLHFKCINVQENIWSVRISLGYRALGIWEDDTVTWFWIGNHNDYQRYFG
jgi:mRNA-degrading endonuclease RelE of RelBE toxin-antitoxin system